MERLKAKQNGIRSQWQAEKLSVKYENQINMPIASEAARTVTQAVTSIRAKVVFITSTEIQPVTDQPPGADSHLKFEAVTLAVAVTQSLII